MGDLPPSSWRRPLGKDRKKGSERSRDKDRDKGRDREKHREKVRDRDRERGKDREREREKDRERETEREDDGKTERGRDMEKYDKSRTRDKDRDASWEKGGEEYERMEVDGGDSRIVRNDGKEADAHASNQEKPLGSQSTSELEERLIRMKQEKLKRKADDASEILSWVSKSRKLEGYHEVAVGKGLSGALKLLKDRGTLKESIDWGGRNMDKRKSKLVGINDNDGPKEIRIERTDEFGRVMTPKEAFRMISYKFHGKGPGKIKQEKRMKQYQEDLTKKMKGSDTPFQTMERMREVQAQMKSPYIVLY